MARRKSTRKLTEKPAKICDDFPLFAHRNGQWCAKRDGRHVYFGPWDDPMGALERYHAWTAAPSATLRGAIDKYLASLDRLQQSGEITQRHYRGMEWHLDKLADSIGETRPIASLTSEDYGAWRATIAATNGAVSLNTHIRHVRAFLNWCRREGIIKDLPPGDALRKPTCAQLRKARAAKAPRMFSAKEIRRMLISAGPTMRAMALLALNCGLSCEDVAQLKTSHIKGNGKGRYLDFPRVKTSVERKVPLWPETWEALKAVIRPGDDVVFRTKYGNDWRPKGKMQTASPISARFRKLLTGLNLHKPGKGFYALRHTCSTIGQEFDKDAAEYILGHAPAARDMSAVYRQRMSRKRLMRVLKHIRRWLGLKKGVKITM